MDNILWYWYVNDVQNEKQAKSERLTLNLKRAWSFELLPLDVLKLARVTEEKMPSSLIQREEQRFVFVYEKSGFLWRFHNFLFSLLANISPKAILLKVWWSNLFIDEFVVVLGGKQMGFELLAQCSIAFWSQPFVFGENTRFGKMQAWLDQLLVRVLYCSSAAGCLNEVLGFGDVLIAKDQKRNLQMLKRHVLTGEHCFHMFWLKRHVLNRVCNF